MSFEWKIYDFLSFGWFWVLAQNFREKFWFWAKLKKPKKTTGLLENYKRIVPVEVQNPTEQMTSKNSTKFLLG